MKLSLIAAMDERRVIGSRGKIPWHLPADLKHFKELTLGHPIIIGRKTYESIGRALPGRTNIVLSRNPEFNPTDCVTAPSLKEALELTRGDNEVFVIGGESIYKQALPIAQKIYLTLVHVKFEGDAFFPIFSETEWKLINSEQHEKDEKNPYAYTFLIYEKKQ
jgi:dihydrofolate reductase